MFLIITYLIAAFLQPAHLTVVANLQPAQPTVAAVLHRQPVNGIELQPAHLTIVKTWEIK